MIKGLEALSDLRLFTLNCKPYEMQSFSDKCDTISKELKILEILKTKKVTIGWLSSPNCKTLDDYNFDLSEFTTEQPLTQEEFDTLKEWIKEWANYSGKQ